MVGSQAGAGGDVVLAEDAIGDVAFDGAELSEAGVLDATVDAD